MARVTRPSSDAEKSKETKEEKIAVETEEVAVEGKEEELLNVGPVEPTTLEEADPNEELWPDGPTVGQVLEWRNQHKVVVITCLTATLDEPIMWRRILRHEYRNIVRQVEDLLAAGEISQAEVQMIQEELVTQVATLFPVIENFDNEPAGMPAMISQQVLESSGFVSFDSREL